MPTYDYECESCGHAFEHFQSITARPLRKCPACGRRTLRRLIGSGGGILFKGSGFYETDYRSEAYKKAAKAEKQTASDAKSGGDSNRSAGQKKPSTDASAGKPSGDPGSGAHNKRKAG